MGEGQAIRTPEGAHPRMDADEEARFLAAAFKFLAEISYGEPVDGARPPSITSGSTPSAPSPTRRPAVGRRAAISGQEWLQKLSSPPQPSVLLRAVFTAPRSAKGSYRFSLHMYIPPSVRRVMAAASGVRANKEDWNPILLPTTGKAQSYRHLLPSAHPPYSRFPCSGSDDYTTGSSSSSEEAPALGHSSDSGGTFDGRHGDGNSSSSSNNSSSEEEGAIDAVELTYRPDFLDDPELRSGKHRTVISLASFLGSIVHFTKAEFLKRELNEKFRKLHPNVHPSLTLSQIRTLKAKLIRIAVEVGLEFATIARCFTFLEKLILRRCVYKDNRKTVGACCLLLAAKATDARSIQYGALLNHMSTGLLISRQEVVDLEFAVFAALKFQLQVSEAQFGGHLERILTAMDYSNLQEYLGERMFDNWQQVFP